MIAELDARAREVLRQVVDAYVATGEPVGSRTVAQRLGLNLSPATIRNVMAELAERGLLAAPHVSAGRVPTDAGLRLFVDGILELGDLPAQDQNQLSAQCAGSGQHWPDILERATRTLAGLSSCAGLVVAPKLDRGLRQVDFVHLGGARVLVILVTDDGMVENRVIDMPAGLALSQLNQAANFINARLGGQTLAQLRTNIERELAADRAQLDALTAGLVTAGLAQWAGPPEAGQLILRGQAHLLQDIQALAELEKVRRLFDTLEAQESLLKLMAATGDAAGVKIFIGGEHQLFAETGYAMVLAPYRNSQSQTVGAIGVIGPTRLNYARVIPMVDYTAKLVSQMMG